MKSAIHNLQSKFNNDGVSDIVGYMIIMAIILVALSVVYAAVFPVLYDSQNTNYVRNIEQSFKVLGFNINRIVSGGAPSQSIEIKLRGGTISTGSDSRLVLDFTNVSGGPQEESYSLLTVEHYFDGQYIAYEGGGIWSRYMGVGSMPLTSIYPSIIIGNVSVVPVGVSVGTQMSGGGQGMARVEVSGVSSDIEAYLNASRIYINVTSDYCSGWEVYFRDKLGLSLTGGTAGNCTNDWVNASFRSGNTTLFVVKRGLETRVRA